MTATALTQPGERDRAVIKFGEIDWVLALVVALIATAGGVMLFSIAGSSWKPWAADHMLRFGAFFVLMIVLALIDLRVWFHLAYPIYGLADPEKDPRMGDLVLSCKSGYSFSDSLAGDLVVTPKTPDVKGTHGYDSKEPGMHAEFSSSRRTERRPAERPSGSRPSRTPASTAR